MSATDVLVKFTGVQKSYDGSTLVVRDLNLDIQSGEFLSLLGPSGSGKTTTLMMLAGFESPTAGEIFLAGKPITVTDPNMTRYFMTIPEASQLVLQAGMLGKTGKVFVLDMGEPVRILELATDMARLSGLTPGYDIEIACTGVRPGEKLYEELFTDQERSRSDVHAKVFETSPEPRNPAVLERQLRTLRSALVLPQGSRQKAILQGFLELLPTYSPSPTGLGAYAEWPRPELEPSPQRVGVDARRVGLLSASTYAHHPS